MYRNNANHAARMRVHSRRGFVQKEGAAAIGRQRRRLSELRGFKDQLVYIFIRKYILGKPKSCGENAGPFPK